VRGKIIKVHRRDVNYKGHVHHASSEDPLYEIKSDTTDHNALHKAAVLRRHCFNGRQGDLAMYQKILLAFDGSPDASEALAQAKSLASMSGATVRLLAIIDPSENMLVVEGMSFVPDNRRFVTQSVLDAGVRRLQGAGCTVTNDVRYGNPAEQIVLSAREMNADLIVVGHRDQGTLARWLNGSVGASILHHPPCSVLVAVKSEQQKKNVTPIRKTQAQRKG
jgi:nucleotide-binding universal stress UspA family protein